MYIGSICGQQLFRSLRAHQRSSDQMKILKDQSAIYIYIFSGDHELTSNSIDFTKVCKLSNFYQLYYFCY